MLLSFSPPKEFSLSQRVKQKDDSVQHSNFVKDEEPQYLGIKFQSWRLYAVYILSLVMNGVRF